MKKLAMVFALAVMIVIPVFAMDFLSAGVQLGTECGVVGDFEITDKIDGYITGGWSFGSKHFHLAIGGLYDVADIQIDSANHIDFKAGAEFGVGVAKSFAIDLLGVASLGYDFKIQEASFTAFAKLGLGLGVVISQRAHLDYSLNVGLVYNF